MTPRRYRIWRAIMVALLCLYVLLGMWAIAESFPHFIRIISDG